MRIFIRNGTSKQRRIDGEPRACFYQLTSHFCLSDTKDEFYQKSVSKNPSLLKWMFPLEMELEVLSC